MVRDAISQGHKQKLPGKQPWVSICIYDIIQKVYIYFDIYSYIYCIYTLYMKC